MPSFCSLIASIVLPTRSTSRSVGPRPLATRQTRFAPPATPAAAAAEASSGFSHVYLRMSAFEPRRWEQYEQSSGQSPDFRLTR